MFVVLFEKKLHQVRRDQQQYLCSLSTHAPQIGAISTRVTSSSAVKDKFLVISSGVDQDSNTSSSAVHRVHGYEVPHPHLSKGSAPASHGKLSTKPSDCVDLKLDAGETRGGRRKASCDDGPSVEMLNARITAESREKGAVEEGIFRVWCGLACLSKPRRLHIHVCTVGRKQCMQFLGGYGS